MFYMFLNRSHKLNYKKMRIGNGAAYVFLAHLFLEYDVTLESHKITKCIVRCRRRLLTNLLTRLILFVVLPFSLLFSFKKTINGFGGFFEVGDWYHHSEFILTIKEQEYINVKRDIVS